MMRGPLLLGLVALFAASPNPTPAAITLSPTCGPTTALHVTGVNFNPFAEVLVTFDAAAGGRPESFTATTDGFGGFGTDIKPSARPAGAYVVRADDFRLREATATFTSPCPVNPTLRIDPGLGRPGQVVQAIGAGFPAGQAVVLQWSQGLLSVQAPGVTADASGSFQVPILIFHHDQLGPRTLSASPAPGGQVYPAVTAPFLVVPGSLQPSDMANRR